MQKTLGEQVVILKRKSEDLEKEIKELNEDIKYK